MSFFIKEVIMSSLGCNACGCEHNKDNCCCLSSIHVQGKSATTTDCTCCGNFKEQDENSAKNSTACPKLTLDIKCDASNCVHNSDSRCVADHIDISGISATESGDTVCASFKCK